MRSAAVLGLALLFLGGAARADTGAANGYASSGTDKYSQATLLKNWALSACLAEVATDPAAQADANATASAYLEFGRQPVETYDGLRQLAQRYAHRRYSGSVASDYNTMKCIDLFHSAELDALVKRAVRKGAR